MRGKLVFAIPRRYVAATSARLLAIPATSVSFQFQLQNFESIELVTYPSN